MLSAALLIAGCGDNPQAQQPDSPKPGPSAGPVSVNVETLKASYDKTKKAYESEKTDLAKKEHVDATVAYATAVMAGGGKPSEKYPLALDLYDQALALDPGNEEAKTNRQLIVDIYKSLGKEPPKK
jgi:hypothetical protein